MEGKVFCIHSQNPLRTSGLIKRSNRYSRFVSCLTKWESFSHCTNACEIDIPVTGDAEQREMDPPSPSLARRSPPSRMGRLSPSWTQVQRARGLCPLRLTLTWISVLVLLLPIFSGRRSTHCTCWEHRPASGLAFWPAGACSRDPSVWEGGLSEVVSSQEEALTGRSTRNGSPVAEKNYWGFLKWLIPSPGSSGLRENLSCWLLVI